MKFTDNYLKTFFKSIYGEEIASKIVRRCMENKIEMAASLADVHNATLYEIDHKDSAAAVAQLALNWEFEQENK